VTVDLGSTKYLDLDSNEICGDVTLQPYTSVILISTETECPDDGVSESQQTTFRLFPNPANEKINIASNFQFDAILIMDFSGRIVMQQASSGYSTALDVSELENGMYVVKIANSNGEQTSALLTISR
jgi:hypothetical protein